MTATSTRTSSASTSRRGATRLRRSRPGNGQSRSHFKYAHCSPVSHCITTHYEHHKVRALVPVLVYQAINPIKSTLDSCRARSDCVCFLDSSTGFS
eukprot:scaffold316723_cov33-Prasinocladus_malaysianus.AAC.1